jgi:hypothetical protein
MYIIFGTIIILVLFLFGSTLYNMLTNYTSQSSSKTGNIWFSSLLIVNITLIIFIYSFYYYKSTIVGKDGISGERGFSGKFGENCIITMPNEKYYVEYNKI